MMPRDVSQLHQIFGMGISFRISKIESHIFDGVPASEQGAAYHAGFEKHEFTPSPSERCLKANCHHCPFPSDAGKHGMLCFDSTSDLR
jgi:hypothetical protein